LLDSELIKQEMEIMKNILFTTIIFTLLMGCSTLQYQDPNYLTTSEIIENDNSREANLNQIKSEGNQEIKDNEYADSSNINSVNDINYYNYSYSSRIRRFHHPMLFNNYYGGIYTDYYWYDHDPFYYGQNIYLGYGWSDPYYNPHYYGNYYTPYYYGNYYSYYGYGSNLYGHYPTYNYHNNNSYNNGAIYTTIGHRGSLSTTKRSVKKRNFSNSSNLNTNSNNISNKNLKDNINIPSVNKNFKTENNEAKKYYNPKSNNKSYSPKRNNSTKNYKSGNRNSSKSNRRNVKPR